MTIVRVMKPSWTFLLYGFFFHISAVNSQHGYYASTEYIETLFHKEIQLMEDVESYVKNLEEEASSIRAVLQDLAPDVNKRIRPLNPVGATMLFKRFELYWANVFDILKKNNLSSERESILNVHKDVPSHTDINGAFSGIFLLQETYNLDPLNFSNGLIMNEFMDEPIQEEFKLSIMDMDFLGKLAYNRGYHDRAIDWVLAAIERNKVQSNTVIEAHLNKTLSTLHRTHDEFLEKRGSPRGRTWRTFITPFDQKLAKKKKYRKALKLNNGDRRYKSSKFSWDIFNKLCRGETLRPPSIEKGLKSFYLHYNNPYLRLGPFKAEIQSLDPSIVLFRDFITDSESDFYIQFARSGLESSFILNEKGESASPLTRTSMQRWINEDDFDVPRVITRRIELATGLNANQWSGNEPYQIANYGLGGVYNAHLDSGRNLLQGYEETGDRLATVMAYLSDVRAGGATAFPHFDLRVMPEKGTAVFWYNLNKYGYEDVRMQHGGCPVLSGTKWITNKWIREFPNMNTHPCTTSTDSLFYSSPSNE